MKKFVLLLVSILLINIVNGTMFEEEFTDSGVSPKEAEFQVMVMKYEPFPVNPGDFFDLWIKVENIGQEDALNARFELILDYPFSSTGNLVKEYGKISGKINAFKNDQEEETQVVLKYRVKAADDAPEGENDIEFKSSAEGLKRGMTITKLQIEVGKTKTSFDVVMQDSTAQGTSLAIANIGENPATAVTVRVDKQEGFVIRGPQASIIGNLDKGDFTTVTFQLTAEKNAKELVVKVEYTDIAGVRNRITKKVPVDIRSTGLFSGEVTHEGGPEGFNRSPGGGFLSILLYVIIGIIISIVIGTIRKKIKKKKEI